MYYSKNNTFQLSLKNILNKNIIFLRTKKKYTAFLLNIINIIFENKINFSYKIQNYYY